jgi:DEAD/DEAH box helicase domain-containing protein
MSIQNFIESLEDDKKFHLQLVGHKYIPPVQPLFRKMTLAERLENAMGNRGIERFFSHQVEAVNAIRQGRHVVIMTPTASGKSLIYNIPVIESIIENPGSKALYLFPLKGLEQDQVKNLNDLFSDVALNNSHEAPPDQCFRGEYGTTSAIAEVYDGDTTAYKRKKIRESLPNVIFTNPDMLHLAINPFHKKWEEFFRNLRFVIIDEIHTYRGVFGSHVAHVLRRFRRICNYWGAEPQFIAASATIANPSVLAGSLTGLPFDVIDQSGAPQGGKHFLFINPVESAYTEATKLFISCLKAGLKTIVFTKARKITELIYSWTLNYAPELENVISPYRAGFLPSERREIERRLFSGDLLGVVSTSALELGVDIGGLDCCILCGYPGSVASTWQRAGRVGRHGQESMIALIAMQDALDQYFMRHPEKFFEKNHEAAVIDPDNRNILKKHLPCAASEIYVKSNDSIYKTTEIMPVIDELVGEGILAPGRNEDIWFCKKRMPHREVGIRAIGEPFHIFHESGKAIGELSGSRIFREAFPGSIYLHRGRQYQVTELDLQKKRVLCRTADVQYYTQALSNEETEVISEKQSSGCKNFLVSWGTLKTTQRITGFDKKRIFDRARISSHSLDMPEYVFETEGLWIRIDEPTRSFIEANGFELAGTLHAIEHTAIACIPLFALCDRGDIGGLSYPLYPSFRQPAIFMYDGYEGGIG